MSRNCSQRSYAGGLLTITSGIRANAGAARLAVGVRKGCNTRSRSVRTWKWSEAFSELNLAVNAALKTVVAQVPSLQIWPLSWTGYKIQHYTRHEGHFKWHFDALGPGTWDRQMAMVIYLNSVADGGETCFHRQKLKFKPVAGDAVIFPTFWTHAHCGEIPRSEDKYIISSFISFAIPAAEQAEQLTA
jgi:hypothetical protein